MDRDSSEETLTAVAAIASLTKMQKGISCQRNILDSLHLIVVYTVCDSSTDRASMLFSGKLNVNVEFSGNTFYVRNIYI